MKEQIVISKENFIKKYHVVPGDKHGKLTLLLTSPIKAGDPVPLIGSSRRNPIASRTMLQVQCDCGNKTWVSISAWKSGKAKSCGKCLEPSIGKKYGKLTVVKEAPGKPKPHKNGRVYLRRYWLCKCECGNETLVDQHHLVTGHTSSCGRCNAKNHNHIPDNIWNDLNSVARNILDRCQDINSPSFWNYGGRGIECLMGDTSQEVALELYNVPGYSKGKQIDRIDNNGHYYLGNLRWVDPSVNMLNRVFNEYINKDTISLRPLTKYTFQIICKNNNLKIDEFSSVILPLKELTGNQYIPEDLALYIHKSNKNDTHVYIKRILDFWSRWSGKEYKVYIPTGAYVKDMTNNVVIPLLEMVKSDIVKNDCD